MNKPSQKAWSGLNKQQYSIVHFQSVQYYKTLKSYISMIKKKKRDTSYSKSSKLIAKHGLEKVESL